MIVWTANNLIETSSRLKVEICSRCFGRQLFHQRTTFFEVTYRSWEFPSVKSFSSFNVLRILIPQLAAGGRLKVRSCSICFSMDAFCKGILLSEVMVELFGGKVCWENICSVDEKRQYWKSFSIEWFCNKEMSILDESQYCDGLLFKIYWEIDSPVVILLYRCIWCKYRLSSMD